MNPVVLPIVGIFILAGVIIWMVFLFEKKRTSAWESISHRLGAKFTPKDTERHTRFPFRLFNSGSNRKMKNYLEWESEGIRIHLADYQYTTYHNTGRGRSSKVHKQTICILEKEGLDLPVTFLRGQVALLDWVGEKFGAQDIEFADDPEFSKAFVIKGDEVRTPQVFGHELRQHFLQQKKTFKTFEMSGNALMINFGKRRKPEEYADLVAIAMPVFYMLNSQSAW
ncbi:MAG: hypothetical protein KAW14_14035 [Candidatus Aegiribacteria sp.]|nr:hypothetical protein [Candidatus Aegiribacteria sp.]